MFNLPVEEVSPATDNGIKLTADDFADSGQILIGRDSQSNIHPWNAGQIIGTLRECMIGDISWKDLSGYFPEMRVLVGQCQFNNRLNMEESGAAVQKGMTAMDRYVSYCTIVDSIEENNY